MRTITVLFAVFVVTVAGQAPVCAQTAVSFAYPQSVVVDSPNGHIWVTDFDNHRVLRFAVSALTAVDRERAVSAPGENFLSQNYPNPFNPTTQLSFALVRAGRASVHVYDLLGREVATLFDGAAQATTVYTMHFDAQTLPSGIYVYALRSASGNVTKKMCVVK